MRSPISLWIAFSAVLLSACTPTRPAHKAEEINDVVYGRVGGAALLMDVLKPVRSNGLAVIAIPGSGWGTAYPRGYDQPSLKEDHRLDTAYCTQWTHGLMERGYTVFVIDHRFAPEASALEIAEDTRQAVRFVRTHAAAYGVDPARIGVIGHSSGGHLASLLGTTDGTDSVSARVQAVVTLAAPFELTNLGGHADTSTTSWLESVQRDLFGGPMTDSTSRRMALAVSPFHQATADDAPHLIFYATDDPVILPRQAEAMHARLVEVGVASIVQASDDAGHNPTLDIEAVDNFFRLHLAANANAADADRRPQ